MNGPTMLTINLALWADEVVSICPHDHEYYAVAFCIAGSDKMACGTARATSLAPIIFAGWRSQGAIAA